jgi:hypothetical protein
VFSVTEHAPAFVREQIHALLETRCVSSKRDLLYCIVCQMVAIFAVLPASIPAMAGDSEGNQALDAIH